jgi:quinone-modifying oxidoreductase, subunit QmoB
MENAKLGVYICTGCGIADAVDEAALVKVAQGYKPALCKVSRCLCSDEDVRTIHEDAARESLTTLCIAACSPRAKAEVFDFDGQKLCCDRVSLREGVAWVTEPKQEETQALAEDYLRMGITRAQRMELLAPYEGETQRSILVVGGGASGLSAAITAARAGYPVILVEKEERLGGFLRGSHRRFPHSPPYHEPEPSPSPALAAEVAKQPGITVRTRTVVKRTEGQPGSLEVTLDGPEGETKLTVGAVVLATGFTSYDAKKLPHLGYGQPNVLTCAELEGRLGEKPLAKADGYSAKSVAFVLCAGSRDPQHLPYCSSVCCRTALKQALLIRRANPEAKVYIFYRDLRASGLHEEFYRHVQRDPGIFLLKGDVTSVKAEKRAVTVEVEHTPLGEKVQVEVELLVLATGMQPRGVGGITGEGAAARAATGDAIESALNLGYRQGPNPPVSEVGFADSKFICFPYETRRTGIFAAGCVREPMDSGRAIDDGAGAAMKAMQAVELISEKRALHPRAGDLSFPSRRSSCSAAPSASAAPRSARSARSTRTRRGRPGPTRAAAGAAASAWAPAPSASSPSPTTRCR